MSFWRVAQLFFVYTISVCLCAPFFYDMNKQNFFDDSGLYKFGDLPIDSRVFSHVMDMNKRSFFQSGFNDLPVDARVFNHVMNLDKRGTLQKLRPYFGKNPWTKMFNAPKAQSQ